MGRTERTSRAKEAGTAIAARHAREAQDDGGVGSVDAGALVAQDAEMMPVRDYEDLLTAFEQTYSNYTLLARQVEDLMYLDLTGLPAIMDTDDVLPNVKRVETILRLRRLRHENPIAKQAVRLTLRFIFGKGISYMIEEPNFQRIVDAFWLDPVNQSVLTSHASMVQRYDDMLTDGEFFFVGFESPEPPYLRLGHIPMEQLTHILYDPDNDLVPAWYRRSYKKRRWDPMLNNDQGGWEISSDPVVRYYRDWRISDERLLDIESRGLTIPEGLRAEGKVKHRLMNPVRMKTGMRGIPELFASREWIRVFKEFMEDRAGINAMANALAVQRKVKGGQAALARITGRLGGVQLSPTEDGSGPSISDLLTNPRRPRTGSLLDTTGDYDMKDIRVDTGATDAKEDARLLLMPAAAGVATPINYLGDTNTSLAGAQAIELPMVKGYEDGQTGVKNEAQEFAWWAISVATGRSIEDIDPEERRMAWKFTPIMTGDVVKRVSARAQLTQQVAPKNRAVRRLAIQGALDDLDVPNADLEMQQIDDEEGRLAREEDERNKLGLEAQKASAMAPRAGGLPDGASSANGNGSKPDGQKASGGTVVPVTSPDVMRLTGGRPPSEPSTGPRSRRQ